MADLYCIFLAIGEKLDLDELADTMGETLADDENSSHAVGLESEVRLDGFQVRCRSSGRRSA